MPSNIDLMLDEVNSCCNLKCIFVFYNVNYTFKDINRARDRDDKTWNVFISSLTEHDNYISENQEVLFTYEVKWEPSEIIWASRWDIYLTMSDVQIHWFSIINSVVVVFFLSGSEGLAVCILWRILCLILSEQKPKKNNNQFFSMFTNEIDLE